ncbi:tectonin beta-propeller repeat-containing protein 1-like [Tubulanus polymorphus]|uniref:tectonin beta-propeller repeat-containing protein 1-like n=1 Tax=Tubulanus polymorphus TaxID=672921 RepID=UPI003DA42924
MPPSYLWAIGSYGRIYHLSTSKAEWEEVNRKWQRIRGFKRVSAHEGLAWAIGSDQQIYVYVHLTDVPIRQQEVTYENERWTPLSGYSGKKKFPVDRWNWSNEDGTKEKCKDTFKLPSDNWEWEKDWFLDENLKGHITDKGGWQYATNFYRDYYPEKKWNSFVRRRKWIRYRRYIAVDTWARVPSANLNPKIDPFIDIAVGGYQLPNQPLGFLAVWAVTFHGKILYREGVCRQSPEGDFWKVVVTDMGREVTSISVGPMGLVWAITWDGQALVRSGVAWNNIIGDAWTEVDPPSVDDACRLSQVAVGTNVIWAVSRNGKVWFRKGIRFNFSGEEHALSETGTNWIEMVGEMSMVSVGPNDQVFGIGAEDRCVYFRTCVTAHDLSGKTWKCISLPTVMKPLYNIAKSETGSSFSTATELSSNYLSVGSESYLRGKSPSLLSMGTPPSQDGFTPNSSPATENAEHFPLGTMCALCFRTCQHTLTFIGGKFPLLEANKTEPGKCSFCGEDLKPITAIEPEKHFDTSGIDIVEGDDSPGERVAAKLDCIKIQCDAEEMSQLSNQNGAQSKILAFTARDDAQSKDENPNEIKSETSTGLLPSDVDQSNRSEIAVNQSQTINDETNSAMNESIQSKNSVASESESTSRSLLPAIDRLSLNESLSSCASDTIIDFVNCYETSVETTVADSIQRSTPENSLTNGVDDNETDAADLRMVENPIKFYISDESEPTKQSTLITVSSVGAIDDHRSNATTEEEQLDIDTSLNFVSYRRSSYRQTSPGVDRPDNPSPFTDTDESVYEDSDNKIGEDSNNVWVWVNGSGCVLDSTVNIPWVVKHSEKLRSSPSTVDIEACRANLLRQLHLRNNREVLRFRHYERAVEQGSWVKKGNLQWLQAVGRRKVIDCSVELEQVSDSCDGYLTLHYSYKNKQKHLQVNLKDVLCICRMNHTEHRAVFGIYTCLTDNSEYKQPIQLKGPTEKECDDWMVTISTACSQYRGENQAPSDKSVWATTSVGDVFTHSAEPNFNTMPLTEMYSRQIGGHLEIVESGAGGAVTWAIGVDRKVWVYTGGYGGGVFKDVSDKIHVQIDKRVMSIYEHQKWHFLMGYTTRGYLLGAWNDKSSRQNIDKDNFPLPMGNFNWTTDWRVDFTGETDKQAWQYARNFYHTYHGVRYWNDYVRKRRWIRECKVFTSGPWLECGNIQLQDISVQVDQVSSPNDVIAVWAISQDCSVLCRMGVTRNNPQGEYWQHVATDQPFVSISVGGNYRIWAICKDGSAYFRNGVTRVNPLGSCWFHVILPSSGSKLQQISVGRTQVWAVDETGGLWFRKDITITYPEGTKWISVCRNIDKVSVGPEDQVWAIASEIGHKSDKVNGVICRRIGITENTPMGTDWELGIGGGWQNLCVRACCMNKKDTDTDYKDDVTAHDPNNVLNQSTMLIC